MIILSLLVLLLVGFCAGAAALRIRLALKQRTPRLRAAVLLLPLGAGLILAVLGGFAVWVLLLLGAFVGWLWASKRVTHG